MLFNSFSYAVFLPIVFALYWIIPHKFRWALLLTASYYFYMNWNPKYVGLILFTTVISYASAIMMEKKPDRRYRKGILISAGVLCLGVLFFFKYFNFISESIADTAGLFSLKMNPVTLDLLLPVGISFYTFQTLSYVIDVYRGDIQAEHHFGKYATFVSFFPQLVAGPIERSGNLLPQIKAEHRFDDSLASYGLKQMAWGFFKKIAIADTISKFNGVVFDQPHSYHGFTLVLAVLFFTIQIYCDFSGYSDIAIGTAKLMGINLTTNFKSPYFSQSVKEFWSRWHISLSTWFRDYVYIPLGGNRVGKVRHSVNLLITFLTSGLWHGANWTFVIWGGVHGAAQILENSFLSKKPTDDRGIRRVIRIALVFCFCAFAWIFFASRSVADSFYIIRHMWDGIGHPLDYLREGTLTLKTGKATFLCLGGSLLLLAAYDYYALKRDVIEAISSKRTVIRWCIYVAFIIWLILNIPTTNSTEFIYFQF